MVDRGFLSPFLYMRLFFFVLSLVQKARNSAQLEGMYMGSEILHTHFYKTHLHVNVSVSEGGWSRLIKVMSSSLSIIKQRPIGTGNHLHYFICTISSVNSVSKFYLV